MFIGMRESDDQNQFELFLEDRAGTGGTNGAADGNPRSDNPHGGNRADEFSAYLEARKCSSRRNRARIEKLSQPFIGPVAGNGAAKREAECASAGAVTQGTRQRAPNRKLNRPSIGPAAGVRAPGNASEPRDRLPLSNPACDAPICKSDLAVANAPSTAGQSAGGGEISHRPRERQRPEENAGAVPTRMHSRCCSGIERPGDGEDAARDYADRLGGGTRSAMGMGEGHLCGLRLDGRSNGVDVLNPLADPAHNVDGHRVAECAIPRRIGSRLTLAGDGCVMIREPERALPLQGGGYPCAAFVQNAWRSVIESHAPSCRENRGGLRDLLAIPAKAFGLKKYRSGTSLVSTVSNHEQARPRLVGLPNVSLVQHPPSAKIPAFPKVGEEPQKAVGIPARKDIGDILPNNPFRLETVGDACEIKGELRTRSIQAVACLSSSSGEPDAVVLARSSADENIDICIRPFLELRHVAEVRDIGIVVRENFGRELLDLGEEHRLPAQRRPGHRGSFYSAAHGAIAKGGASPRLYVCCFRAEGLADIAATAFVACLRGQTVWAMCWVGGHVSGLRVHVIGAKVFGLLFAALALDLLRQAIGPCAGGLILGGAVAECLDDLVDAVAVEDEAAGLIAFGLAGHADTRAPTMPQTIRPARYPLAMPRMTEGMVKLMTAPTMAMVSIIQPARSAVMSFSQCLEVTAYEGGADAGDRGPDGHDLGYGVKRGHAALALTMPPE